MKMENGEDRAFILGAADLSNPLGGPVKPNTLGESPGLVARKLISTSSASLPDDEGEVQ
jgi:hypothetical protein